MLEHRPFLSFKRADHARGSTTQCLPIKSSPKTREHKHKPLMGM